MEDRGGDLRKIRDDARRLLDRIDTRLLERQEQQDSKQREQVLIRLLRASGIAVVLGLAWGWLRSHQREVVAAAVTIAAGSVAVLGPPGADDAGEEPSLAEPPPPIGAAPTPEAGPGAPVTATIQTAEPSPEPAATLVPVKPNLQGSEPSAAPTMAEQGLATATLAPSPTPTPSSTQSPDEEDGTEEGAGEEDAEALCLDLETRPVDNLGVCIRELLGLVD